MHEWLKETKEGLFLGTKGKICKQILLLVPDIVYVILIGSITFFCTNHLRTRYTVTNTNNGEYIESIHEDLETTKLVEHFTGKKLLTKQDILPIFSKKNEMSSKRHDTSCQKDFIHFLWKSLEIIIRILLSPIPNRQSLLMLIFISIIYEDLQNLILNYMRMSGLWCRSAEIPKFEWTQERGNFFDTQKDLIM